MTESTDIPKPPAGLGRAGKAVWLGIVESFDLDPRELMLLATAARQADLVEQLEKALERDGLTSIGAAGQVRFSAIPAEIRQGRLALGRLLGELRLPATGEPKVLTAAGRRAQHASQSRWARVAAERQGA